MLKSESKFINPDLIETNIIYRTSKGSLHEKKHSVFDYDLWSIERPVKSLFTDMPLFEEFYFCDPSYLNYESINEACIATGDYGICEGIVGNTFFEFLTLAREGGAVQVILDLNDYPDYFIPIQKRYIEYLSGIAEEIAGKTNVEGLFLNCGSSVLSVTSPQIFKKWDLPLIIKIGEIAKKYNKIFHYHLHGKGRIFLEDLINAGVNMLCPLEEAPRGDFSIKEVKDKFAGALALKGNMDPFFLQKAGPEEIEEKVRQIIKAASNEGGFTLSSADGVLKDTTFENIEAFVLAGRKFGSYSLN